MKTLACWNEVLWQLVFLLLYFLWKMYFKTLLRRLRTCYEGKARTSSPLTFLNSILTVNQSFSPPTVKSKAQRWYSLWWIRRSRLSSQRKLTVISKDQSIHSTSRQLKILMLSWLTLGGAADESIATLIDLINWRPDLIIQLLRHVYHWKEAGWIEWTVSPMVDFTNPGLELIRNGCSW